MKRITALFLLIMTVALSFVSCTAPYDTKTEQITTPITTAKNTNITDKFTDDTLNPTPTIPSIIPGLTNDNKSDEKTFIYSNWRKYIYNNMYFYVKQLTYTPNGLHRSCIKYQYIDNTNEEGHYVFSDTTNPEESFFWKTGVRGITEMAIDIDATKENGGIPIIIFTCNIDGKKNDSLLSYNMANNQGKIISEDLGDEFKRFYIYGDRIYYSTVTEIEDNKKIVNFHSIKKDGTEYVEYSKEFINIHPSISMYNDKIYYTLDISTDPYIYVADIDFANSKKMMKLNDIVPNPKIKDGYIYYADDERIVLVENTPIQISNIYRFNLNNFESNQPELVLQNIYNYHFSGSKLIYYMKDDIIRIGDNNSWYFAPHVLRMYDINTQDTEILIDSSKNDESIINIMFIQSKYLVLGIGKKLEERFIVNTNTGKIFPYPKDI